MDDSSRERLNELFGELPAYDRQGRRIGYTEFKRLRADDDYRFVARDQVGELNVVTAWLGLDQCDGEPLCIFGTVTLTADEEAVDGEELFAATESEALSNHAAVLARRRESCP